MPICVSCGKEFDLEEARSDFNRHFRKERYKYDDAYPEEDDLRCGDCAIYDMESGLSGYALLYGNEDEDDDF